MPERTAAELQLDLYRTMLHHPAVRGALQLPVHAGQDPLDACTSTSGRRRSRSGVCAHLRAERLRHQHPPAARPRHRQGRDACARSWPSCSPRAPAAARARAARCTSATCRWACCRPSPSSAAASRSPPALALACKQLGNGRVAVCFFGDGATNEGAFHEALNMAAIWRPAGGLRLREQPVRRLDAGVAGLQDRRRRRPRRGLRHAGRDRRRQRRAGRVRGGRASRRAGARRRRPDPARVQDLPPCAATRAATRAPTAARRRKRNGRRATRSSGSGAQLMAARAWPTQAALAEIEQRGDRRDRRRGRLRRGQPVRPEPEDALASTCSAEEA